MAETSNRYRVAVRFRVCGDLRFLSHRDVVRMLGRGMVRADLPLRYSQGFNPKPRWSLPVPRSVGTAGDDEWFTIELTRAVAGERLRDDLARQMPAGLEILAVEQFPEAGSLQPRAMEYSVDLRGLGGGGASDLADAVAQRGDAVAQLGDTVARLLASETVVVTRVSPKHPDPRQVDVRPLIEEVELRGDELAMRLTHTTTELARPTEVLAALGLPVDELRHRIVRRRIIWACPWRSASDPANDMKESKNGRTDVS